MPLSNRNDNPDEAQHNNRSAAKQNKLEEFQRFGVKDWYKKLKDFLNGKGHRLINGRQEISGVLIGLYRDLDDDACDQFAEAVFRLFETTPLITEKAYRIYHLLQLLSFIKPLHAKPLLRRHLKSEALLAGRVSFAGQSLHTLLLQVNSKYDIDENLIDYVLESSKRNREFSYLLVCLRLLLAGERKEAFHIVEQIIRNISGPDEATQLVFELKAEVMQSGYRQLCLWYSAKAQEIISDYPVEFKLFEQSIREYLIHPQPQLDALDDDPFKKLLTAQLYASSHRYTPKELVGFARLHTLVGFELAFKILDHIWHRTAMISPFGISWSYTLSANYPEIFVDPNLGIVSNDLGTEGFNIRNEPELDDIFNQVGFLWAINAVKYLNDSPSELEEKK
jgi:hypothetical protein